MNRMSRRRRIEELNAERATLERRFEEVSRELENLRGALRENDIEKSYCAPIQMLPDDVLKIVFEEAYDHSRREDCHTSDAHAALDVLDLSQVSRRWRGVALSLPRLWRCIHIVAQSSDLLALFVERSSSAPISIVCNTPDMYQVHVDDWWVGSYLDNMVFVWQYAHLLDAITVRSEHSSFSETLLQTMQALSLPLLHSLRLWLYDDDIVGPWFPNTIPFRPECPLLESFAATWIPIPSSTPSFGRLTTLSISGTYDVRIDDLIDIANATPQLKHIVMDYDVAIEEMPGDSRSACFPFVESLAILECEDVTALLNRLDLPTLKILVIGQCGAPILGGPLPQPRPFPTVHTLYIEHQIRTGPIQHSYLFQHVPEITTLEFSWWRGGRDSTNIAMRESLAGTQQASLSRLQTLVLTGSLAIPDRHLREIIEQRGQQNRPLKELQVGRLMWERTSSEEKELLERCVNVKIIQNAPCTETHRIAHK